MSDKTKTSDLSLKIDLVSASPKKVHREVVRVATSCWKDKRGVHIKKSLMLQKKLSEGHQMFNESFDDGAEFELSRIENLNEVKDGLYEIITINIETDWETGYLEACDYKLVPFKTSEQEK